MKLDSNIYGMDETGMASEAASKALSSPKLVDPFDHANASKGGGGDAVVSNSDAKAKSCGEGDSPKSKGN